MVVLTICPPAGPPICFGFGEHQKGVDMCPYFGGIPIWAPSKRIAVFSLNPHLVGPGIFDIFPNGFNRGPYILIFLKGF